MSKEHQNHEKPDELDLDVETVRDLEPNEDADDVRGGYAVTGTCHCILTIANCPASAACAIGP